MNNLNFSFIMNKSMYFESVDCFVYCNYKRYNKIHDSLEKTLSKIAYINREGKVNFYKYNVLVSNTLTIKDYEDIQKASELVRKFNGID